MVAASAGGAWWWLVGSAAEDELRAGLSLQETLGGADTVGYARATAVRSLDFPGDHGAHPDFRNEWWYLTGNLETAGGRRFGYQVTFFRTALAPAAPAPVHAADSSRWRTRQAWMAHLTVADVGAERFHAFERFERGALGLAGATLEPAVRVWTGGWELSGGADGFPSRLSATVDSVGLELALAPVKPPVLQGDRGLSRKGPEPGNASYYYSMTRLRTEGSITTPDGTFAVEGSSWLDREWSTSVLSEGVVGWDWFALQLEDGREVMLYELRGADGTASPFSSGVVVGATGEPSGKLGPADFSIEVLDRWASPRDGSRYPSRWRVRIPRHSLDLEVRPVLADQELRLSFRYWEGAVDVLPWSSSDRDAAPAGRGYVELTGYAGTPVPSR